MLSQADNERLIRVVLTIVSEVDLFLDKKNDDFEQGAVLFYPKYLTDEQYIDIV